MPPTKTVSVRRIVRLERGMPILCTFDGIARSEPGRHSFFFPYHPTGMGATR